MAPKAVLRTSLGLVWLYEGLVLKILVPGDVPAMIQATGLYWPTPALTADALGLLQIACALWLLSGWQERRAVLSTTTFMCALLSVVIFLTPSALFDPFGGIPKDIVLVAAAYVVWTLAAPKGAPA
jgi:hypothetical protein